MIELSRENAELNQQSLPSGFREEVVASPRFASRALSGLSDAAGSAIDFVSDCVTNRNPATSQLPSDIFWFMEFGSFGPFIRDAWFGKK